MKIVILGTGNVATNLQHALTIKHIRAEMISSRRDAGNQWQTANGELPQADCYIYAVADNALREVAAAVHAPKSLHLHTSGTMPIEVFGPDKPHAGVMYFFQSFSKLHLIEDWSGIPVFVEGKNIDDIAAIYTLAQTLSSRVYECGRYDRERLHVAGVFANNFTNLMYRMAADILHGTQIPFAALLPLIDQTAAKVHTMSPRDAQTGPAMRHDENVMAHHLEVLQSPEEKEVYQLLSELITKS